MKDKTLRRWLFCITLCFVSLFSSEIPEAFKRGKMKAHIGTSSHIDLSGDSTFFDLNSSLSYMSANFYGYKFFSSVWFNPPLYESKRGFRDNKIWFEITELGVNFFHSQLNYGFDAGRFSFQADWVGNYVQGLSFFHTYSPLLDYSMTWINQAALIKDYKMKEFRSADNWLGGLLLEARIKIPQTIIELHPYIYSVADLFWASAVGANATFKFLRFNADLIWKGTLLTYVGYHNLTYQGSGILFWSDLIYKDYLRNFDAGGGIMATNGVKDLAIFGQNTEFENIDGMLNGVSTTLYAFGKLHFAYATSLKVAMRLSLKSQETIFGLETRLGYSPINKMELGLGFSMLNGFKNPINQDHYILRTFLEYHF